jgi:hypothetical protein
MASSVATGERALQLVLDEIARRDPDGTRYHVALTGESQGAWVVNDLLAEHPFERTVDEVSLYGLPGIATHDDALRDDERVQVTNHRWDPVTWRALGSADAAADAGGTLFGGGGARSLLSTIDYVASNPVHAAIMGIASLRLALDGERSAHPHVYDAEQRRAADHLLDGYAPG